MSRSIIRKQAGVCLGKAGQPVGQLTYVKDGAREYSAFAYAAAWLVDRERIEISPDLPLVEGHQTRRASTRDDSCFHFALADTEPDAWGRRVIARAHAKRRQQNPSLNALTEFDYLSAVHDFSRIGALRLTDGSHSYLETVEDGKRATPPLIDLPHMLQASLAVELGTESAADLQYLLGKGTSLGGMRPKCSLLDHDGSLALGKFPSAADARSVTRGEVLALRLAGMAGIETAPARIEVVNGTAVAVIGRFDRSASFGRIPYLSAASMLQAARHEERAYTEIADAIRAKCAEPTRDVRQLWRRMVFNLLITNVDDHLQNLGFLHSGDGKWRLAPAFDLNPFPDKDRESKTWLNDEVGPITSLTMLIKHADYFSLSAAQALASLKDVHDAIDAWRRVATGAGVGMEPAELQDFAAAFEHSDMEAARRLVA